VTEQRIIDKLKYLCKVSKFINEDPSHKFMVYPKFNNMWRMTVTGYNIALFKPRNAHELYGGISDTDLEDVAKKIFNGQ
jgi:hypothetical protein